jgi:hypothetical protein
MRRDRGRQDDKKEIIKGRQKLTRKRDVFDVSMVTLTALLPGNIFVLARVLGELELCWSY